MGDYPKWDYWINVDLGDGRLLPVDYDGWLSEGDIRQDKYALDWKKWCRRNFWKPEQAALISFCRDPDKVLNDPKLLPLDDDYHPEHVELLGHIDKLFRVVEEAPELPPVFTPAMYVEWAQDRGIDLPGFILEQIAERELQLKNSLQAFFEGQIDDTDVVAPPDRTERESSDKRRASNKAREENSFKMIIFALLLKGELIAETDGSISKTLLYILEDEFKSKAYRRDVIYPKQKTIEDTIKATRARVREFLISR